MSDTVIVALISAGGSVLVAITALLLNYRGFSAIDSRFASVDSRFASLDSRFASLDSRFASLERRLDGLDADIKTLVGAVNDLDRRLTRVEIKLGIQP